MTTETSCWKTKAFLHIRGSSSSSLKGAYLVPFTLLLEVIHVGAE